MTRSLEDLPARMLRCEERAFEEFVDFFRRRLRGLGLARGLSVPDAEAFATSCLTDVALKVDRFTDQGAGSFERWVLRVAHNQLIDELRKKEPSLPLTGAETEPPEPTGPPPEVLSALEEALAELTETDREVIFAHHLQEQLPFAEIGERLGIPEGTVRVRHHRALKKLAGLLEDDPATRTWIQGFRPVPEGDDRS